MKETYQKSVSNILKSQRSWSVFPKILVAFPVHRVNKAKFIQQFHALDNHFACLAIVSCPSSNTKNLHPSF